MCSCIRVGMVAPVEMTLAMGQGLRELTYWLRELRRGKVIGECVVACEACNESTEALTVAVPHSAHPYYICGACFRLYSVSPLARLSGP
jgi:hypothetical protein